MCDNISVVFCVNSGSSKCCDLICLVRDLFFVCAFFCIDIRLFHVPGVQNIGPDMLSRGRVSEFRALFSDACQSATPIPFAYHNL